MKTKLAHPLWTHLPSAAAFIGLVVYAAVSSPLAGSVPVHFDFSGEPDSYGSPWLSLGLTIGLSLFFIVLSAFLDDLWAKQEKKKTFNWLSLLDDIVVGAMAGIDIGYLSYINEGAATFTFPWGTLLPVLGGAVVLAVVLELVRPYRPRPKEPVHAGDRALQEQVAARLHASAPFLYWDYQNPAYMTVLTVGLPVILLVAAVFTWFSQPWAALILAVVGMALILPHGGQRTLVTRDEITIRWGLPGFRVLRLRTAEIASAEVHEFSPLKDFGGYGIRFNREMKAYYLRGTNGVKLTMNDGKKYLIGSDSASDLAAVIMAAMSAMD